VEPLALPDRKPRADRPAARLKPMAKRSHTRSGPVDELRRAIDCLPAATRQAMLDGVQASERIIAGAYVDGEGGVCPMLAAHRRGARTNFLSFSRAWDRFARTGRRTRAASARELDILVRQLQGSLFSETHSDLDRAIAEHRDLVRQRESAQADPSGTIRARRLRLSSRWKGVRARRSAAAACDAGGETPPYTTSAPSDREPAIAAHS
jgi:hypothetical protein